MVSWRNPNPALNGNGPDLLKYYMRISRRRGRSDIFLRERPVSSIDFNLQTFGTDFPCPALAFGGLVVMKAFYSQVESYHERRPMVNSWNGT